MNADYLDLQTFADDMADVTLYLHEDKKTDGTATPTVGDGNMWSGKRWKQIIFVNDNGEVVN